MAGHLMGALKEEPHFDEVGVGTMVVYHGRAGMMRMGRTVFPAVVLHQHPDDGSLDLHVIMETDDMIFEQRVLPYREEMPDRSWEPVNDGLKRLVDDQTGALAAGLAQLRTRIFGEYKEPEKSVMEYLADFDQRLRAIEKRLPKK